ncbi:hypothetical protein BDZ97DRAFT_2069576 [Flammula alnicola]|nr:hypothetical protein BDZ97DRAFT_2069576 [Flammula alnicola]
MSTLTRTETSPSREVLKKVEKELKQEEKQEEKSVRVALKDLSKTEKQENKAQKAALKADVILGKVQTREQDALKGMYKAQQKHEIAVSNLHMAQHEADMSTQSDQRLKDVVQAKTASVEEAMDRQDEHARDRNAKLDALKRPPALSDPGRVIPESEGATSEATPTKNVRAQSAVTQSQPARSGTAQSETRQSAVTQSEPAKNETAQSETGQSAVTQNEPARSETPRSGTAQSEAGQSEAGESKFKRSVNAAAGIFQN